MPNPIQTPGHLMRIPIAEARAEKWRQGRLKYGGDTFVGHPLEQLHGELIDAMNYCEEAERWGIWMGSIQGDLEKMCLEIRKLYRRLEGKYGD